MAVGYVLGNLGSIITIKNEINELKVKKLNKEILAKINEIWKGNAKLVEIKQNKK